MKNGVHLGAVFLCLFGMHNPCTTHAQSMHRKSKPRFLDAAGYGDFAERIHRKRQGFGEAKFPRAPCVSANTEINVVHFFGLFVLSGI